MIPFVLSKDPLVWLQALTFVVLLLIFLIWAIWGRGPMKTFFLGTITLKNGRPNIKNLTMFTVVVSFNFLIYRGGISFNWPPEFVFITLAAMISTWIGLDAWLKGKQTTAVKDVAVSAIENNDQTTTDPGPDPANSQGQ